MRILGIDYGDARTGLSISDPSGFLAGSPSVIHEWNYAKLVDKLVAFIQENKIEEIVLGHPKNMDGTVGPRAEKCETLAKELEERTGLHVVLWDERLTTVSAHNLMNETNVRGKKRKDSEKVLNRKRLVENGTIMVGQELWTLKNLLPTTA